MRGYATNASNTMLSTNFAQLNHGHHMQQTSPHQHLPDNSSLLPHPSQLTLSPHHQLLGYGGSGGGEISQQSSTTSYVMNVDGYDAGAQQSRRSADNSSRGSQLHQEVPSSAPAPNGGQNSTTIFAGGDQQMLTLHQNQRQQTTASMHPINSPHSNFSSPDENIRCNSSGGSYPLYA